MRTKIKDEGLMQKILMTIGIALLAVVPAHAADLPIAMPVAADITMAAPSWTGLYIGANVGGGVARYSRNGEYDSNPVNDEQTQNGSFFGGQIGYNAQISSALVLGVEADYQRSNFNNTFTCGAGPYSGGACYDSTSVAGYNIDQFGTIRARLGYANNNFLAYVTGGVAAGNVSYSALDYQPDHSNTASAWSTGWVAGVGGEYKLDQHWSVKGEYLHIDLGTKSIDPIPAFTPDYKVDVHAIADVARFGINYSF
jgi:outer membrane immunogenic protein